VSVLVIVLLVSGAHGAEVPVPDGRAIKARVLKSLRASEDALENYSCIVRQQSDELDEKGGVKKHRSSVKEQFFVNGVEVEHTLERDGKPLSEGDAKKEQDRVDKEVKKYSDVKEAEKKQARGEKQADKFLRALSLTNGRRESRGGRNTLFYDLAGDPDFRARSLEERFAKALDGKIAIDEDSGTPTELRFQTTRDVKIGGGLLANLHKGFWLHVTQQREPDGAWITKSVEGNGDARAALFMRARFRFREDLDKCHLFRVKTEETVGAPPPQKP
jgi:hypothetical protein